MSPTVPSERRPGHGRFAVVLAAVVVAMVGMAYAAVPLYRTFCQLTGFDGTTGVAKAAPTAAPIAQTVKVSFDTNVRGAPLLFTAEQPFVKVKIGATQMALFKVTNTSNQDIRARATYNVVPEQAGYYFRKLECFCFTDQTIKAGQTVEFPMVFFIDPGFAKDRETRTFTDVALSYTYWPTAG
ncbi:MAG TPA: cytochrome c oxidase assembly protein [Caulobacteraceae bacterium]|jgi:cytochrome c oxidase assembly protein subunit 11